MALPSRVIIEGTRIEERRRGQGDAEQLGGGVIAEHEGAVMAERRGAAGPRACRLTASACAVVVNWL